MFNRKDMRKKRLSMGLCSECGKELDASSGRRCYHCREIGRNSKKRIKEGKKRLLKGLCFECGNEPIELKSKFCKICLKIKSKKRGKNGICITCDSMVDLPNKKSCKVCRSKSREKERNKSDFYKKRRVQREIDCLCKLCGIRLRQFEKLTCERCKNMKNYNRQKLADSLLEAGVCSECRNPLPNKTFKKCESCRDRLRKASNERINRRRASGVCINCPDKSPVGKRDICMDCWCKQLSKSYMHSNSFSGKFKELYEKQGGRCAYTNELLVIGESVHLDHKTPLSRGGTNTFDNFQFIHKSLNILKDNKTDEEFRLYLPKLKQLVDTAVNNVLSNIIVSS